MLVIIAAVLLFFAFCPERRCPECGGRLIDDGDVSILGEYFEKSCCKDCGYEE